MARAVANLSPYPALDPGQLVLDFVMESIPESTTPITRRALDGRDLEGQFTLPVKVSLKGKRAAAKRFDVSLNELSRSTWVVITGVAEQARLRKELKSGELDDFTEQIDLELDSNEYRGRMDIQAFLMYRDGNARYPNYRCGESEPLSIQFDSYESPPGSDIEMHWVDFTDPSSGLVDQAEQLFCVRSDTDPPILYLNSSISQFAQIMLSQGTHGAKARIRDSLAHRIASQTWHVLLASTLAKLGDFIREEHEDPDIEFSSREMIGQLTSWQQKLITDFVSEESLTDEEMPNVDRLIERLSLNADRERILIREAADYIQQLLLREEPLDGFIKEFLLGSGS